MLSAITSPLLGSIVIGGMLLGVGVAARGAFDEAGVVRRLRLHAVDKPNEIYISAFRDGDIEVRFPDEELRELTIRVRVKLTDGCKWEGREKLVPLDDHQFHYDYSETILSCEPGATPAKKTPRQGIVTVE